MTEANCFRIQKQMDIQCHTVTDKEKDGKAREAFDSLLFTL